ncbi:ABC transporter substrate-binding protein [Actinomadura bangladeshensis]|uniref:ABC transporter substrate-binding protein n=2 Tax=Actinomadura bangladeshensis TaxID=453573 RepID=A0A4R4PEB7_9ACTN|nr:ABC transporter substrate-binding protein [Actinomadura bangladeshensis]
MGGVSSMVSLRTASTMAAVLLTISACGTGQGASDGTGRCGTFTLGALDDDSHRAAYHAIEKGRVKSEVIGELKINYLQIPALIQATASGQYDVVGTSLPGVVNAREKGGVDLRIVGLIQAQTGGGTKTFVPAGSGIRSGHDLKGKTVGVSGFGSSVMMSTQIVYTKKYGLDAKAEGGDIKYVELDPQTMYSALKKGDIDAAVMFHQTGWRAGNDPGLRVVADIDNDFREVSGAWLVGAAYVVPGDLLKKKAKCVAEFQRMIGESVAYAEQNVSELAPEISRQTGVDAEFIEYWWNQKSYRFGGGTDAEWIDWAGRFYRLAHEGGYLPKNPDLGEIVVNGGTGE